MASADLKLGIKITNAQIALQAAATVYAGKRGTTPAKVKLLAESFKNWLDWQDQE